MGRRVGKQGRVLHVSHWGDVCCSAGWALGIKIKAEKQEDEAGRKRKGGRRS